MPRKSLIVTVDSVVDSYRAKYPERSAAIEEFLKPYTLPGGKLQNDDKIIVGLKQLSSGWRKSKSVKR